MKITDIQNFIIFSLFFIRFTSNFHCSVRNCLFFLYAVKAQNVTSSVVTVSWFTALLLRMHTNVVHFRVMRRLCRREMKLTMKLTMREPTFMGSMTTDHVITACDV